MGLLLQSPDAGTLDHMPWHLLSPDWKPFLQIFLWLPIFWNHLSVISLP